MHVELGKQLKILQNIYKICGNDSELCKLMLYGCYYPLNYSLTVKLFSRNIRKGQTQFSMVDKIELQPSKKAFYLGNILNINFHNKSKTF